MMETTLIAILLLSVMLALKNKLRKRRQEPITEQIDEKKKSLPDFQPTLYRFNTDPIRYELYATDFFKPWTKRLHDHLIVKNLWINEPFHSELYKLLMILNRNEFFIRDPYSKVIKSNLRNDANQMITVNSYTVLSTLDIVKDCIFESMASIEKFQKSDAQTITLSLILWVLQDSENMTDQELSELKTHIFEKDARIQQINEIVSLIGQHHSQLTFVHDAYDAARKYAVRHPFTSGAEYPKNRIRFPKMPEKVLQALPNDVY